MDYPAWWTFTNFAMERSTMLFMGKSTKFLWPCAIAMWMFTRVLLFEIDCFRRPLVSYMIHFWGRWLWDATILRSNSDAQMYIKKNPILSLANSLQYYSILSNFKVKFLEVLHSSIDLGVWKRTAAKQVPQATRCILSRCRRTFQISLVHIVDTPLI